MIRLSSHHIAASKVEHVKNMEKEVKRQLKKYKGIFSYLVDYNEDNTKMFNVNKENSVNAVINLSNSSVKNKSDIDDKLQCILSQYRSHAVEILRILNSIEVDIKNILEADREKLIELIQEHNYSIEGVSDEQLNKIFKKLFNYDAFSNKSKTKYCAYTLTENLKIIACPYCNRMYTLTVIFRTKAKGINDDYVTRPELDHYFPKSKYPIFALSFYNLIPSCSICNKLKGDKTDIRVMHHHPYFDETKLEFRLDGIKYDSANNKFNDNNEWDIVVDYKGCSFTQKSIEIFRLYELYREHNFIVEDMIEKAQKYNQTFIESVELLFSGVENPNNPSEIIEVKVDIWELLERIFGILPSEEDHKNPMNKFKRTIYKSIRKAQNI